MTRYPAVLAVVLGLALGGCGDTTAPAYVASVERPLTTETTHPPSTTSTAQPTTTTSSTAPAPPPPTTTTAPPVVAQSVQPAQPASSGDCGGWGPTIAAHFPPGQHAKACAVMGCETGYTYDPTIYNRRGSGASGLWQFMPSTWESTTGTPAPAAAYSGDVQTAAAAKLWRAQGWGPWSCA